MRRRPLVLGSEEPLFSIDPLKGSLHRRLAGQILRQTAGFPYTDPRGSSSCHDVSRQDVTSYS